MFQHSLKRLLVAQCVMKVTLSNHKIQRESQEGAHMGVSFTVSPDSKCLWHCTQTFGKGKGRQRPTHATIGAAMKKEVLERSEHVTWHLKFMSLARSFIGSNQQHVACQACVVADIAHKSGNWFKEQVCAEGAEHQARVAVAVAEEACSVDQGLVGASGMMRQQVRGVREAHLARCCCGRGRSQFS